MNKNKLMSKKHKNVCTILDYIEHFFYFILDSTITCCCFLFCFFSWYSNRNYEFCNRIKSLCNNFSNEKYKSMIKKKKKKHDKIVLLAKAKLNSIEILISMSLVDSVISHDDFF